jgi:hypothetical protein
VKDQYKLRKIFGKTDALTLDQSINLLKEVLKSEARLRIMIDALDKCDKPTKLLEPYKMLQRMYPADSSCSCLVSTKSLLKKCFPTSL